MKITNRLTFCMLIISIAVSNALAGTITDRDGNKYKTVKIGNQHWMAEDYRFESNNSSCATRGSNPDDCIREYRMSSMTAKEAESICPTGWHLPEPEDIRELRLFFEPDYDNMTPKQKRHADSRISTKLRSKLWNKGEDAYGFNALPNAYSDNRISEPDYAGYAALRTVAGLYGDTKQLIEFGILLDAFGAFKRSERASRYYHIRCIENKSNSKKESNKTSSESLSKPYELPSAKLP